MFKKLEASDRMLLGFLLIASSRLINDFWFAGYRSPTHAEEMERYATSSFMIVIFVLYKSSSNPLVRLRYGSLMLWAGILAVVLKTAILAVRTFA
jgi:hypothetical protein